MEDLSNTGVLLVRWREGEEAARDRLVARLHPDLAQIAAARLRREQNTSLSTGDLINGAVMRLIEADQAQFADRAHIIALASRLMRHILIDHARQKRAAKRRHVRVELCTSVDGEQRLDLVALDAALIRLGAIDRELMELVEMRYFGGMAVADIAAVTHLSESTIKRRWRAARAWLATALENQLPNA